MERYEGVLVMCTNLFDQLDSVALRRFDVKAKLGFLRAGQCLPLLAECIDRHEISAELAGRKSAEERLAMDRLTPEDFQTVLRRRRLVRTDDVLSFVDALAAEQEGKRGIEGGAIGFRQAT